ncbi:MAG: hypothetical protein AAGI68_10615 [Planctomycetota bacterium]
MFLIQTTRAGAVLAVVGCASSASGGFTTIAPPFDGEVGHEAILESAFGGDFVASGLDFSNGTITATRVDDDDNQLFEIPVFDAEVEAVFASLDQTFGYLPGPSGGDFVTIFDVVGKAFNVTGSVEGLTIADQPFRFARRGANGIDSSLDADNGGLDKLVTYEITGLDTDADVTLLFFEDLLGTVKDDDFQDLVVKVTARPGTPRPIPNPAALGAGLVMLGALMLRRRRTA